MEPSETRARTPMTERLVGSMLRRSGQVGLDFDDNMRAYRWRMYELQAPITTRIVGLFCLGPRIALGL